MSIAQLLAQILAARYGRDVRQSIHDAIGECYDDVSTAKTLADAAAINANDAATLANEKAGLVDAAATLANEKAGLADTAAANANTAAGSANTAASSANTAAQTANAAADNAEAKAILANNAAQYASGFTQPYIHIKYSAVQPTSNADMVDIPSDWIGLYSGNSATAPVNYTDYRWFRYKGETGDVGNHNHDTLYLGIDAKAVDSDKLDGKDSTEFARSSHDHDTLYLGIDAKAVDSDKLDGKDSTEFSDKVHTHTKSEITDFPTEMPPEAHNQSADTITTGILAVARGGTGVSTSKDIALLSYPVGAIYISTDSTSPATLFGGTWAAIGGRFLIGADGTYAAGATGGAATVALGLSNLPYTELPTISLGYGWSNGVTYVAPQSNSGYVGFNPSGQTAAQGGALKAVLQGSNAAHNNMPPYLAVYMWKRTA